MNLGEVWKYGETINPGIRYSVEQPATGMLNDGTLEMIRLNRDPQYQMKAYEKGLLLDYFITNGTLPPGNRIYR
jgi:hypothetical protein